jgi:hypothetical protein
VTKWSGNLKVILKNNLKKYLILIIYLFFFIFHGPPIPAPPEFPAPPEYPSPSLIALP